MSETKIDKSIGDIRIVCCQRAAGIEEDFDSENERVYIGNELINNSFIILVDIAKEILYDGTERDEKTVKYLKRTFACVVNKLHKQMLEKANVVKNKLKNSW